MPWLPVLTRTRLRSSPVTWSSVTSCCLMLDQNNDLLVGNGAWSYTLSRVDGTTGPDTISCSSAGRALAAGALVQVEQTLGWTDGRAREAAGSNGAGVRQSTW